MVTVVALLDLSPNLPQKLQENEKKKKRDEKKWNDSVKKCNMKQVPVEHELGCGFSAGVFDNLADV